MKPSTIADEIFVSWNAPSEFSNQAEVIIENALNNHFMERPRFHKNSAKLLQQQVQQWTEILKHPLEYY
jgi:hypothetical protein